MKANQQQKKNGILNFLLRLRLRETFEYVAVCKVMIPGLMRYVFFITFWDIWGMRGWCIRRGAGFSIASFSGAFACLLELFFSFLFSAVCFSFIVISPFLLFMFYLILWRWL